MVTQTRQTLTANDLAKLKGVHPALEELVIECANDCEVAFTVFEGVRTLARQRQYVKNGVSKTLNSYHLVGLAVDLVPMLPDKKARQTQRNPMNPKLIPTWDVAACRVIAAAMARAYARLLKSNTNKYPTVPFTWGGSWKWFDGPHFQLVLPRDISSSPRTAAYITNGYTAPVTAKNPLPITAKNLPVPTENKNGPNSYESTRSYQSVIEIQEKINRIAARTGQSLVSMDGKYGAKTEGAIKLVQTKLGVHADGVWGPATDKAYDIWMQEYNHKQSNHTEVPSPLENVHAKNTGPQPALQVLTARASIAELNETPHSKQEKSIMAGYKTYIVALCAVLSAVGSYFAGEATAAQAIQLAFTAVLAATLRSGVSTTIDNALEGVLAKKK